jgi:hypothetical protein
MKLAILFGLAVSLLPAVVIPTAHFDNSRNGANTSETVLTPTAVGSSRGAFHKLGVYSVDGDTYAQPLYIPGTPNVVIIATLHNKIYAFDADQPGSAALWTRDVGAQRLTGLDFMYSSNIGCLSTPGVDVAASRVYVVCQNNTPTWTLYSLNLATGAVVNSVDIAGEAAGTGDTAGPGTEITDGANITFLAQYSIQRSAITLANGKVYVAFGSYDSHPYHGWIMAYDKTTLTQTAILCTTPNSYGGAIWHTPGPAVDGDGNLYVATGNGTYDGVTEFANSLLKLSPSLAILDTFTPADQATLEAQDGDLSSGTPMLIPGTSPALIVIAGKDFNVFVVDTSCMGFLQGSSMCTLQTFITKSGSVTGGSGSFGGMMMNNHLFLPVNNDHLYDFTFDAGTKLFNTTPVLSALTFGSPSASQISGSANGASTGIVWAVTSASSAHTTRQAGTLRAFDPVTLAEIWNSGTSGTDTLGNLSKFASPLVANGKVYVGTGSDQVTIYGMGDSLPSTMTGHVSLSGKLSIQ